MECHDEHHAYLTNSSQNNSDFVTRKPLRLLRQLKKCNEIDRCAINKTLNELRSKFPAELKFGAALNTEDSFFDAVAQGLNDLRAKGSITRRKPFHVTSLRLRQKIDCDEIRVDDNEAHVGIPFEGRIICQKFNIRIILRELLPISNVNEICTRVSKETSVGDSFNVVYIVKQDGHYVPLLSSLQKDIKVRMKVPRREVYGRSSDLKSLDASSTSVPLCTIENGSRVMPNASTRIIVDNRNHSIAFNAKNGANDSNMFLRDPHNVVVAGQRNAKEARKRKKSPSVEIVKDEITMYDPRETRKGSREREQSNPDIDIAAKKKKKTKQVERSIETIIISDEGETKKDSCEERQANTDHEKAAKRRKRQPLGSVKITNICDERERNNDYSKIVADLQAPDADVTYLCEVSSDLQFQNGDPQGAERIGGNNEHPSAPKRQKRNVAVGVEASRLRDLPGNSRSRSTSRNIDPQKRFGGDTARSVTKTHKSVNGNTVSDYKSDDDDEVEILTRENGNADCSRTTEASKVSTSTGKNPRRISTSTSATKTTKKLSKNVVQFMYIVDLAVLCFGRKSIFKSKYRSLMIKLEDTQIEKLSDIVFRKEQTVHIRVLHVCNNFEVKKIGYSELFSESNHSFSIHSYFSSFLKYAIALNKLPVNVNHLVLYTNCELNFDNDLVLLPTRTAKFYPFKFVRLEDSDILKDLLSTQGNADCQGFYKFSEEESNKRELMIRLQSEAVGQKYIQSSKLKWRDVKEMFLDKLIFAVNQPDRQQLSMIVKKETREAKSEKFYPQLKEKIIRDLTQVDKYGFQFIYPFHVALALLHTLFLHGHMVSINCKSKNAKNGIVVNYRERLTHINAAYMEGSIGYEQLFPSKTSSAFSLNKQFARFVEGFGRNENMRFVFILTNGYLALDDNDTIKGSSVKVQSVDIGKKKYKVLRNCSFVKSSGIYQFAVQEEETKQNLLRLLEFPQPNDISSAEQEQLKVEFLNKLLIAFRQPIRRELIDLIKTDIDQSEVPYSYIELQEVTLRWLESFDRGDDITKESIEKMLSDIRNNRSSGRKLRKNIEEEIRCARGIAGHNQTVFDDLLAFLVEGEGKECLEILRREGLKPRCVSSILHSSTNPKEGFLSLFRLWFDERGETTKYLKSLQNERISLSSMTSVLKGSGVLSSLTFKELYDLWFDESGEKSQYLQNLERGQIPLSNITTIIAGAGVEASRAFKEMHDLLFDANGTASQYLESMKKAGISFTNMSTIIKASGRNGMNAFKALHNAWLDMNGNKSNYLRTLENNGIDLTGVSSILSGSGLEASTAFEQLYSLWFDCNGHKTEYMNTLDRHEVPLHVVSSILTGSSINAVKAFKKLFYVWFKAGQKTRFLINLELNGIRITNMSSIVSGARIRAAETFIDLYNEWIDENGQKSQRLKDFTEADDGNCFELSNLSSILNNSGARAKIAFQKLHSVCYDTFETRPSNRFNDMVSAGFNPSYITSLLAKSTIHASSKLKAFYDVCFDEDGRVTPILNDFYRAGFTTNDICNALTSSALKTLKEFHDLCFKRERTKQYLSHFLNSGIMPSHICDVLHGSKLKVCSAFEELHNACFEESGIATQLLSGFNESGFTFTHLCQILVRTGVNAALILKKLYNLCFDETGRKTSYFSNLLEAHSHSQVIILLKSKIRRS